MKLAPAVFKGKVSHTRLTPVQHSFHLPFGCYFVPILSSEASTNALLKSHNIKGLFKRKNYLGTPETCLKQSVLTEASKILKKEICGDVYFLGQLPFMGFYFSSVNFYFIVHDNEFKYLLSEVANTPWNERHYYCLSLDQKNSHAKEFHVSPFNPMDMKYVWTIKAHPDAFFIKIDCYKKDLHFSAQVDLKRSPHQKNYTFMNIRMLLQIYWQALLLFVKRTPIYPHPKDLQ